MMMMQRVIFAMAGWGMLALAGLAQAQPQSVGSWSAVQTWPIVSVNALLLPNGKVMFYPYNDDARLWDPADGTISSLAKVGYNLFCSGHSYLSDGKLLVTGGHISNGHGLNDASYYDPFRNVWQRLPDMNDGRWYPSSTTLGNGDVVITSGARSGGANNDLPQVWQTAQNSWRNLDNATLALPLYPRQFLAPNGLVFVATHPSRYLNPSGRGSWTTVANRIAPGRDNYGSACLYGDGKVLFAGGGDPPMASAEVIDLTGPSPSWRAVGSMAFPRRQHNVTLLADGTVLADGGSRGAGFDNSSAPVLPAEIWDAVTETWRTVASAARYRGYHSISLLLPDGRVLTAGGDYELNAQIYSPPYLHKGTRPTVASAPAAITYGGTFHVATPDYLKIAQITWIRLGTVTHGFNMDQRINRLPFAPAGSGLNVVAPSSPDLCPPGYYMLFLLDQAGIPSIARILRISSDSGPIANQAPEVQLTAPPDQLSLAPPANIQLRAEAVDHDGSVSKVEFFVGNTKLGEKSQAPYSFDWNNVSAGNYALSARAYDNSGNIATSATVSVSISATPSIERTFVTTSNLGRLRNDYSGWVGLWFTVGSAPLTITELGRMFVPGNNGRHQVKLVRTPDGGVLAAVTVAMEGGVPGQFQYARLANPLTVEPNTIIFLASEENAGQDRWHDLDTRVQTTDAAKCNGPTYFAGGSWVPVNQPGASYGPVNFRYRTGSDAPSTHAISATAVPSEAGSTSGSGTYRLGEAVTVSASSEPEYSFRRWEENGTLVSTSAIYNFSVSGPRSLIAYFERKETLPPPVEPPVGNETSFVTSVIPGRVRNDFSGGVGLQVLVGDPLVVTALGRFKLSGNSRTHTLKLVRADTSQQTASVSVPMTPGASGQFVYGALTPPVTLDAGRLYYVVSEEQAGGDTWYDYDGRIQTTPVAQCPGPVYGSDNAWTPKPGPVNRSYVPVDFKYRSAPPAPPGMTNNRLVSNWKFDQTSGSTALDELGRHPGILINQPRWTAGRVGGALEFDGLNDYVNIADADALDLGTSFSISLWFRPTRLIQSGSARSDLLKKYISYWLIFNYPSADGKLTFVLNSGIPFVKSISTSWASNQWYHAVATSDGSTIKLYIDGRLENSVASAVVPYRGEYPVQIGGNSEQTIYFPGAIDDVRIYNVALTATEVSTLFARPDQ